MRTMTDKWDDVEKAFAHREGHEMFRAAVAAMRPMVEKIKADGSLHDLEPSVSHVSLVFRRGAPRSVLLHWNEKDGHRVSMLDCPFDVSETTEVTEDDVIEVLRRYLDRTAG
jgi:hypothetical protein